MSSEVGPQASGGVDPEVKDGRFYTSARGTAYMLPSDEEERKRLALMQKVLKKFTNKLVHAPVDFSKGGRVLETATGAGTWLMDLANDVQSGNVELIGTDIESNLFPDATTLPSNVHFEAQSVLELPAEWTDRFVFAHQRLCMVGLRRSEWPVALSELYRVLQPGGWVQLFEVDDWVGGPLIEDFKELLVRIGALRGGAAEFFPGGAEKLRPMVEKAGFVNMRLSLHFLQTGGRAGPEVIEAKETTMIGVFRGFKGPVLEAGGLGVVAGAKEYDQLMEEVEKEIDASPEIGSRFVMVCAQKPFSRN